MGVIKVKAKETAVQAAAKQQATAVQAATEVQQEQYAPGVVKEFKEYTNAHSRHYKLNNGTAKSVYSNAPANYYDAAEGSWKAIDNSLRETADGYETAGGKYKTELSKPEKGKKVRLTTDGIAVSWEYLGRQNTQAGATAMALSERQAEETVLRIGDAQEGELKNTDGLAVYEDADKDTDIEYIVQGNGLKENIVVKERGTEYRYQFALATEGLKLRVTEDGTGLELYRETGEANGQEEVEAVIPSPYMYDGAGETSEEVYYELEAESEGRYTFAVVASAEWINAEERVFPVRIDPQIVTEGSEYITKQVQYRTVSTGSGSGTGYSSWHTVNNSYIKVQRSASIEYKTTLTVKKSSMELLDYPISAVKLQLTPYRILTKGSCYINNSYVSLTTTSRKEVTITSAFKNAAGDFTIEVRPYFNNTVNAEFYASGANGPAVEIEYLINGKTKKIKQQFTLAGGLVGQFDVATGDTTVSFEDVPGSDSVLGFGISHVYKRGGGTTWYGRNYRLNLNETLTKDGAAALEADYVYTDAYGDKHGFKDTYYYLDATGKKCSVLKAAVSVDLDGSLYYIPSSSSGQKYEVKKEQRTKTGLTAITKIEGFKGAEWVEQRASEVKQSELQENNYKNSLQEFVIANADGVIQCSFKDYLYAQIEDPYQSFIVNLGDNYLMTENDALTLQSLKESSVSNAEAQRTKIRENTSYYQEQIKIIYKEYLNIKYQNELFVRQLPVNYLTDGTIYKGFNEDGDLVAVFDKYENMILVEYDESGKITAVYDGDDKQIVFSYAPNGLLSSITDTRGRRTVYDYENGELIGVTFASGKSVALEYNASGYLTTVVSSEKMQSALSYTNNILSGVKTWSCVESIEHGAPSETANTDAMTEMTIGYSENFITVTDDKENTTYYKVDDEDNLYEYYEEQAGKVTKAEKYDYVPYEKDDVYSTAKEKLYQQGYAAFDPDFANGDSVLTELDEFNNPAKKTTSARALSEGTTVQAVVTYAYNDEHKCTGEQATVTVKQGTSVLKEYMQVTAYNYNASGNVVRKETYVVGEEQSTGKAIEETVYDEKGNKKKSYTYNSLDASSKFYTESEYAENGQVLAEYDETGENKTEYEYIDGTNVVRGQKLPNGSRFAYGYDADDTVTSITQSTAEGEENSTRTRYTCGEVTELVSGNNVVRYAYDKKRRVSKVDLNGTENYILNTYTDGSSSEIMRIQYVPRGTDADEGKADVFEITKNKRGDITNVKYGYTNAPESAVLEELYSYEYDEKFRVKRIKKGSAELESMTYDTLDRQTAHMFGGNTHTAEYDAYGKKSKESLLFQNETTPLVYTYTYKENAAGTLEKLEVGSFVERYEKDSLGRTKKTEHTLGGNRYSEQYGYYKQGDHATTRVNTVYYNKNGVSDGKVTYTYDAMGHVTAVNENGQQRYVYEYDKIGRLISEKDLYKDKEVCYTYDNNGNILTKDVNGERTEYRYQEGSDRLVSFGTETFFYDAVGNPVVYRGMACEWEKGRQLKTVCDGTNKVEYEYNAFGLRTAKKVYTPETAAEPAETTTYVYENGQLLRQVTGSEVIDFLYGAGGIIGIRINAANYMYRKNVFGDVTELYSESGEVVGRYSYSAYGECVVEQDAGGIATKNPIRYRGYYYDESLSMYYLKSRYYDPELGRFMTIDSVTYISASINGTNLYAYCYGNPIRYFDPKGTYSIPNPIDLANIISFDYEIVKFSGFDDLLLGRISVAIKYNKSIGERGMFYAFSENVWKNGILTEGVVGFGVNLVDRFGLEFFVSTKGNIGLNVHISEYLTVGGSIGVDGLTFSVSVHTGDTTYEVNIGIGWGTIGMIALVVLTGGAALVLV